MIYFIMNSNWYASVDLIVEQLIRVIQDVGGVYVKLVLMKQSDRWIFPEF